MADGFKIGDGFVEVTAVDDTPVGLQRISASIERWLSRLEERIRSGFADAFDAGADAAERRINQMRRQIEHDLRAISGRSVRIRVDGAGVTPLRGQLRLLADQVTRLNGRVIRIRADGVGITALRNQLRLLADQVTRLNGRVIRIRADGVGITALRNQLRLLADQVTRLNGRVIRIRADGVGIAALRSQLRLLANQVTRLNGRVIRIRADGVGIAALRSQLRLIREQLARLDGRTAHVRVDTHGTLDRAQSALSRVGLGMARLGAYVTSLTSLLGPLLIGVALATDYVIRLGAALGTLSATLPAVAAAIGLVVFSVRSMATGIGEALGPVRDAFARTGDQIERMARNAVRPLATEFARVNFPAIHSSLLRISSALTGVVTQVGRWLNSTAGQHMIRTITEATATAMERLAPKLSAVVIAFGNLADRAGAPAIQGLGDLLGAIADATTRWLDGITRQDVQNAIEHLKAVFADIVEVVRDVAAAIGWIVDHVDEIRAASDALAGVGLALAIFTGAWPAGLIAVFTLISNHIKGVTNGVKEIALWFDRTYNAIANNPDVQKIMDDLREIGGALLEGMRDGFNLVKDAVTKFTDKVEEAWPKIAPFVDEFLKDPNVIQGAKDIAAAITAIGLALAALAALAAAANAITVGALTAGFAYIVGWAHKTYDAIVGWVTDTTAAISGWASSVVGWFASLPGQVSAWLDQVAATVSGWVDSVTGFFASLPGRATAAVSTLPGQIAAVVQTMVEQVLYSIGYLIGAAVGLLLSLPVRAAEAVAPLPGRLASIVQDAATRVATLTASLVTTAVMWLAQLPGRAASAIAALPGVVSAAFNSARAQAVALVTALVTTAASFLASLPGRAASALSSLAGVVAGAFNAARAQAVSIVTSLVNTAVSIVSTLRSRAVAALSGLGRALVSAGRSLIQGFIDGVRAMIGPLQSLLNSISSMIPSWKGPPEKDATMLEPAGRSVIRGFMRGVDAQTPALHEQLSGLTASIGALGAAIPAQRGPTGAVGPTYNFAPGSVVLDASRVKDMASLLAMIDGLKSTARQYGARVTVEGVA